MPIQFDAIVSKYLCGVEKVFFVFLVCPLTSTAAKRSVRRKLQTVSTILISFSFLIYFSHFASFPPSSFDIRLAMTLQDQQREQGAVVLKNHVWTPGQELAAKLVFGGLGCMIAVVFTHPVDVIKTRLQLQGEAVVPSGTQHNPTATAAARITGVGPHPGLLSSTSNTHLAYSPIASVTGTVYHRDAGLLVHEPMKPSLGTAANTAAAMGTTTSAATSPMPKTLRLIPLLREIFRTEGPHVLIAGLAPAVLRESIYSTIRFGSYDLFKGIYSGMGSTGLKGGEETSTLVKLLSGLTSGMIGSAIANPTDLIKGKFGPSRH